MPRKQQGFYALLLIDHPNIGVCSNYSFQNSCYFRLFVLSFQNMLLQFTQVLCMRMHPNLQGIHTLCLNQSSKLGSLFKQLILDSVPHRLLVHFETRCYCLHESFVWKCFQNHKALMSYKLINCPSLEVYSIYTFRNPCYFSLLIYSKTRC